MVPVNELINNTSVAPTTVDTSNGHERELSTLREELAAQEALRAGEWEQKKVAEEEKPKIEENIRKTHQLNDRLKEEKEKLLQEKYKLRRSTEVKMQWLKEELR